MQGRGPGRARGLGQGLERGLRLARGLLREHGLKPAQKPEADKKVDLAAFSESVTANENWPSLMPTEGEALDSLYPGLSGISTKQKVVYTPMISAAAGELALVEVSNSSDVQKVKDIFQARISYQVGDEKNRAGHPADIR